MSKIKIITDSTAYINKEYAEEEKVTIVQLNYVFGEETGKEPFPGEFYDFYDKLSKTKLFPSTSQPSTGEFVNAYNEAFQEGYDEIIVVVLSSKISGTYNSAILAKNILEDRKITIIDSLSSASNLRFLVEDSVDMVKKGSTSKEIEIYLNNKKMNMDVYLTTESLEYLSRGGRLSTIQSKVGNLLNIKPIIQLKDGKLELLEKLRGKNKALQSIMSKVPEDVEKIGICHILNYDLAEKLKIQLENNFPQAIITIDELGPVIGSHLGPGAIGLCFS